MLNENMLHNLIHELCQGKGENEWVEFKLNNASPDEIGIRLSSISNMAALADEPYGYLAWGIEDKTNEIVGTDLSFSTWKKGNEAIEAYWKNLLSVNVNLSLYETSVEGKRVLLAEISCAQFAPTTFKKTAYCRVESYTKKLDDYPSIAKRLWDKLALSSHEEKIVMEHLHPNELNDLLDFATYYRLLRKPMPGNATEQINAFIDEGFLCARSGEYAVTALGALLFARDLSLFPSLVAKTIRLVRYATTSRLSTMGKQEWKAGYALCYENVIQLLLQLLSQADEFENGVRRDRYLLPEIALREILANAIIHQEIFNGYGPLIELFPNRLETSNSGALMVSVDRIIDTVPKPRNVKLATFLRRVDIGDSSGSGYDKMAYAMELAHFPAPRIDMNESGVRVSLHWNRYFKDMNLEEKVRATYDHSVLRYLDQDRLTNSSLRERFGLPEEAKYQISRLIKTCVEKGLIKPVDSSKKKDVAYLPYWAF